LKPNTRNPESGLTLVELLIAVALLGIVLLGIAPLFIASVRSNYTANEYTSIHNLARDRLEQLMNLPFNDPQLQPGVFNNDLPVHLPAALAPTPPSVPNPLVRTYEVHQWLIPADDIGTVAVNQPFVATRVINAGQVYDYKRIDVTVQTADAPRRLGIGVRAARVSGILQNPDPVNNRSVVDP